MINSIFTFVFAVDLSAPFFVFVRVRKIVFSLSRQAKIPFPQTKYALPLFFDLFPSLSLLFVYLCKFAFVEQNENV